MNYWIIGVGEPLPIDGTNTRLRRVGNLVNHISKTVDDNVDWFSVSFNHYEKKQRVDKSEVIEYAPNYSLHVSKVSGYKKNVSVQRILHHIDASKEIQKMMRDCVRKPDIILTGNTPIEVSEMVTSYGKQNNIPVVVDIRDLWPDVYYDAVPKKLQFAIKPYVHRSEKKIKKVMAKATNLVALSNLFLLKGLEQAGREKNDLDQVIPMGYPNYNYDIKPVDFEKNWSKYNLMPDDFIISFTGNFGRQFDFLPILEAARILENNTKIKFVLCGTGENFEKIKKLATPNIIFPGWVEKDQIISLLSFSKLGVAPYINSINFRNNTPNKFGEYLSASLPILVSVTGEMRSLLEKNSSGKYYKDSNMLVDEIEHYVENPELLKTSSINARNLYLRSFNGENVSENYKNYLDHVISVFNN